MKANFGEEPANAGASGQQLRANQPGTEGIPQGQMIFELSQYSGKMYTQVEVVIEGNKITVYNSKTNPLTGGKVITEGILLKHVSGTWIIGNDESDKVQEEIGGCTGGPIPIDFESKMIEWC